ncbi:hypothetical protein ZWY2020_002889 [Hordeum vulgare]|nr:hypothetical protein ZWY2020_002889 [Hordeum vulgare]
MAGGGGGREGGVRGVIRCREDKATLVFAVHGRPSPLALEALGFDSRTCSLSQETPGALQARIVLEEDPDDAPLAVVVHPAVDELVWAMARGCRCVRDSTSLCLLCQCHPPWLG